ncbi:S-layer homology domain-containing protein [Paenibacillus eucommiae]|uniref:SLH domain-containing protein n=1 Tax=Paenibacillus eucommiae TaxID=1355755 RepID=A0ABS4IZP3_9BACL|nr:S-layer homology domain-containing protein [Paenibacillus eucommiae]MBP1993065.1 hypothetical protein [Paenibacillus eucommiae]
MNKINKMIARGSLFTLILLLFISQVVHPPAAEAAVVQELQVQAANLVTNLVTNPGFEEDKAGWDVEWPGAITEITNDAHSGDKALRVQYSSLEQTLPIQPGKSYKLEFWAKRGGSVENNVIGINFWDVPGMGRQGVLTEVDSTEYQKYELFFDAPVQFSSATLVIYKDAGEGWVYGDDFLLTELTNIVTNPGFEEDKAGWDVEWPGAITEITNDANSGDKALRVQYSSLEQTVPIQPGKSYKLEFWAKRGGSVENNVIGINFWDVPGMGRWGVLTEVDSTEYQKYELFFDAPVEFSSATLVTYKDAGDGWVYADDFYLTEAPSKEDNGPAGVDKHIPVEETRTLPDLILFEMAFVDHSTTPEGIRDNIEHIDSLPFDGITISAPDILRDLMGGSELTYEDIYDELKVLKGLFKNLKQNYLHIQIDKPINKANPTEFSGDLFDDEAWGIVAQNFKNAARAAKEVGLHNFFLDNEEYWNAFLHHPRLSYYKDKTVGEYEEKARQRGKELMNAILSEIPDAKMVHLHGPYLSDKKMPAWLSKGSLPYLNLYGPLFVGMMEAVKEGGNQGTVIDGGELYLERTEGQFMDSYQYRKYEMSSFLENTFIPESLRQSYSSTVKIGAGLYNREIGGAPMNPEIMRSTLENALRASEDMVWLFHEPLGGHGNWLIPGSLDEAWFDAVKGARQAIQEKPLGTNRIYNSGFEFGKVNWSLSGGAERKTSVDLRKVAHSNEGGLSLSKRSGEARQQLTNLLGGRVYDLSAWAQVWNTDDKAQIGVVFRDAQEQVIAEYSFDVSSTDYSKGSTAFLAPAQFSAAEVYVKREAGNDYIFVDDVFLREWIGAPTGMQIKMEKSKLQIGENVLMSATGLDAQGNEVALDDVEVQFASSDFSVAEISAKGKSKSVKALQTGKTNVVANAISKGLVLQAQVEVTVYEQSTVPYVPGTSGPVAQPEIKPEVKLTTDTEGNLVVDLGKDVNETVVPWNQLGKLAAEGGSLIFTDEGITASLTAAGLKSLLNQVEAKDHDKYALKVSFHALPQQMATDWLGKAELKMHAKLNMQSSIRELSFSVQFNGKQTAAISLPPVRLSLPLLDTGNHKLAAIYAIDNRGNLKFAGGDVKGNRIETILPDANDSFVALLFDKHYSDVHANHWAAEVIKEMSAKHLIHDAGAKLFPEEGMTRAQYIAMLAQAFNMGESKTIPFNDVADGAWYAGWVAKAVEEGLVNGYGNGKFGPDDIIQREQMAVILLRAYEWKTKKSFQTSLTSEYQDREQISDWAINAIDAATEIGMLQGKSGNLFDPKQAVTRAESIMAIHSMLQKLDLLQSK